MAKESLTVRTVARMLGGTLEGDGSAPVRTIAPVSDAGAADVTFAADEKRLAMLPACKAVAAIVAADARADAAPMPLIRVPDVQAAVAKLLGALDGDEELPPAGVDASARVAADAEIGDAARIGPNVTIAGRVKVGLRCAIFAGVSIGPGTAVGDDVILREGVVIRHGCTLGNRVRIGPNSVIGGDGFGYYHAGGLHHRVPHIGDVVIEDDVEIGACTCVDRAKFGSTRIGAGTKIDNLVQIAHNVQIGPGCLVAALVGIAGSTRIGEYVVLGGHAGIPDNITIGARATIGGYSAPISDVGPGMTLFGTPAADAKKRFREIALTARLPDLFDRVKKLEKKVSGLESPDDH